MGRRTTIKNESVNYSPQREQVVGSSHHFNCFLNSGDSIYAAIIDAIDRMKAEVEEHELDINQNRLVVISAFSIITINPLTGDRIHNFR